MKSYIELVPRSEDSLEQEMADITAREIPCDGFNLPELRPDSGKFLKTEDLMKLRSEKKLAIEKDLVLHMRTRDRVLDQNLERIRVAAQSGVTTALLITGDSFETGAQTDAIYSHDVLAAIESESKDIEIAIGADIYQRGWGRWLQKIPALQRGIVNSVFTQPIFHPSSFGEVQNFCEAFFKPENVFAGITWITSDKSRAYWNIRNKIPLSYLPSGESDQEIRINSLNQAADVLRHARQSGFSVYTMMMKGTVQELESIFNRSENIQEY